MKKEFKPALLLDLDGTVRKSKTGKFISGPSDIEILPNVEERITEYKDKGYLIIGITNQGGVAHGFKTVQAVARESIHTHQLLNNKFDKIFACLAMEDGCNQAYAYKSLLRKPYYGMLVHAELFFFHKGIIIDWNNSLMVGDRAEDGFCAASAEIAFMQAVDFFEFEKQAQEV